MLNAPFGNNLIPNKNNELEKPMRWKDFIQSGRSPGPRPTSIQRKKWNFVEFKNLKVCST